MNRPMRRGFTLVELLVVITIIGMLMSLILPAVNSAREAGRRAVCQNNQKQICLATQGFESSRKGFPGYRNQYLTTTGSNLAVSWFPMLFPYMEMVNVDEAWKNQTPPNQFGPNGANIPCQAPMFVRSLTCPSNPPDASGPTDAPLAYVANCGAFDPNPSINGSTTPSPLLSTGATTNTSYPQKPCQGVFFDQSLTEYAGQVRVSSDYISMHDGTTTTLMFAESMKKNPIGASGTATGQTLTTDVGPWAWPDRQIPTGFTSSPYNLTSVPGNITPDQLRDKLGFLWVMPNHMPTAMGTLFDPTPNKVIDQVSSRHPGIIVVSFCDGHQYFMKDSVDYLVYAQLMCPYDKDAGLTVYSNYTMLNDSSY